MSGTVAVGLGLLLILVVIALQRRFPLLQYAFLARFPLGFGVALLVLPVVALDAAPSVLGNLFDLGAHGVLMIAWIAPLAAWVVMLTLATVHRYAPARFGLPTLALPAWLIRHRVSLFALLAVPIVGTAVRQSPAALSIRVLNLGLGLGLAMASLLAATALQRWLSDPAVAAPETFLPAEWRIFKPLLPRGGRPSPGWVDRAARQILDPRRQAGASPRAPVRGYVDLQRGRIRLGHLLAAAFLGVTLLVYAAVFVLFWQYGIAIPALGSLLLILLIGAWILPGLSFFLDLYRVPAFLSLLLFSVASSLVFNGDHFFTLVPLGPVEAQASGAGAGAPAPAPAAPTTVPRGRLVPDLVFRAAEQKAQQRPAPIVLVAASGGGISAALWTARVLTGLQAECGDDVTRSIRLVSAVSGGSVGALYFLDRFRPGQGAPPDAELDAIVRAAGSPSLDEVAWGLAYPDLWRTLFGFALWNPRLDRGWALEQAFASRMRQPKATLGQWRQGMAEGWLPAVVFNATTVEDGRQFLFTGVDLPTQVPAWRFFATYPNADVAVVTAARMSASFPWVSPVARAEGPSPGATPVATHLADGGYYDNDGVVTTVNFLRSLLPAHRDELRQRGVLLVLIRAFASPRPGPFPPADAEHGWLYGIGGPILTMLHVRTSSQELGDRLDLALLRELWRSEGIRIQTVPFVLEGSRPLSWKLSGEERRSILAAFSQPPSQAGVARIRKAFAQ